MMTEKTWFALTIILVACDSSGSPKEMVFSKGAPSSSSMREASAVEKEPEPAAELPEPKIVEWFPITDFEALQGRWIGAEHGDAIPRGPAGGTIVNGGLRVEIVKDKPPLPGRPGTPYNLTFWAPREGHLNSETISGGCGFYPRDDVKIDAFCRGYGLPPTKKAKKFFLWADGNFEQQYAIPKEARLRLVLPGLLKMVLKR